MQSVDLWSPSRLHQWQNPSQWSDEFDPMVHPKLERQKYVLKPEVVTAVTCHSKSLLPAVCMVLKTNTIVFAGTSNCWRFPESVSDGSYSIHTMICFILGVPVWDVKEPHYATPIQFWKRHMWTKCSCILLAFQNYLKYVVDPIKFKPVGQSLLIWATYYMKHVVVMMTWMQHTFTNSTHPIMDSVLPPPSSCKTLPPILPSANQTWRAMDHW